MTQAARALRPFSVEVVQGDPHGSCRGRLSTVIGRELYGSLALAQELSAGEVQGVERANRLGKRLERAHQYRRDQFQKGHAAHERTGGVSVIAGQVPRIDSDSDLVLE